MYSASAPASGHTQLDQAGCRLHAVVRARPDNSRVSADFQQDRDGAPQIPKNSRCRRSVSRPCRRRRSPTRERSQRGARGPSYHGAQAAGGCRVTRSCDRVLSLISGDAVLSAMRAGLTTRSLTFRHTFVCTPTSLLMAFADTGRPADISIQTRRKHQKVFATAIRRWTGRSRSRDVRRPQPGRTQGLRPFPKHGSGTSSRME